MRVICHDCEGTGEIGTAGDGRLIACETCGGHEDELGTGRVDVVCAACADKDAEIARLSAELVATMVESHKLTEWLDKRTTTLRDALESAPRPLPATVLFGSENQQLLRWMNKYPAWWLKYLSIDGKVRQAVLGPVEVEDDDDIGCDGCGNQGSMALFGDNPGDGNDLCRACGNLELQAALKGE